MRYLGFLSDHAINRAGEGKKLKIREIDDSEGGIREDGADRIEDPVRRCE
jgi:hypothetical protein